MTVRGSRTDTATRQPVFLRILKAAALAVALGLVVDLGGRLLMLARAPVAWPFLVAGTLLGYLVADLLSGTVHWFCDTFFAEDTPLIGPWLIHPFRDHHHRPAEITKYGLLEQDGSNYIMVIPMLWLARQSGGPQPESVIEVLAHAALFGFAVGALGTNLFHKWAHAERVLPVVHWFQQRRLILSPEAHAVHHRRYTQGYCVTNGWMNMLLDRLNFFAAAERLIRHLQRFAPGFRRTRLPER